MTRIIRKPAVQEDLDNIWLYIAQDNIAAADRIIDLFEEKCRMLADSPMIGRTRDELAPSLRSFPIGKHIIFYRPVSGGIEIIRVLHGAQDITTQDFIG
jgi:toxin ParE1/3/4